MDSRYINVCGADDRGDFGDKTCLKVGGGAKVIRPVVICLCFIMSIRLIIKEFF